MGKRATVTQIVHTAKNRDGFIEDAFWGPTGTQFFSFRDQCLTSRPIVRDVAGNLGHDDCVLNSAKGDCAAACSN